MNIIEKIASLNNLEKAPGETDAELKKRLKDKFMETRKSESWYEKALDDTVANHNSYISVRLARYVSAAEEAKRMLEHPLVESVTIGGKTFNVDSVDGDRKLNGYSNP